MKQVLRLALLILAAPAWSVTSGARADVLEIGTNGARWIAGGPSQASAPDSAAPFQTLVPQESSLAPVEWRAEVAAVAARYDISPALLEAVVWQESRWRPNAISSAGARGLAQLMPGTARQLGVNPDDPRANLDGGARYLKTQLDAFGGDIVKALAAYNAGPGRVQRAGGVPKIRETQQYVAAILNRLSLPVRR